MLAIEPIPSRSIVKRCRQSKLTGIFLARYFTQARHSLDAYTTSHTLNELSYRALHDSSLNGCNDRGHTCHLLTRAHAVAT